ncbi:hypothetical protein CFOL_v3_03782 [Cephalotus follicularis]|uniref:CCHC-type domain-containing protein n=1 Tax=Cephalotus follicularis TaxID=3775 RepID=A0A1Q3AWX6_CEPFO|nr:hypothetical protein CFOL_v3_03782 [Cephalotus follicularis]
MEFDHIRAHVLNRDPFPSLEQAYSMVQSEDSCLNAMVLPISQERSALYYGSGSMARGGLSRGTSNHPSSDRPPMKCDYCGKERHFKVKCWKLQGRPTDTRAIRSLLLEKDSYLLIMSIYEWKLTQMQIGRIYRK